MIKTLSLASALVFALAACGGAAPSPEGQASAPAAVVSEVAQTADTVLNGTFTGRSDHITTGTARIVGEPGSYTLVFDADFELDGAPDPVVGFGADGSYDPQSSLGALQKKVGAQSYQLPSDFNPAQQSEVYVWCDQFSVPLGVAALSAQ